jgi:hypothetical protein
MGGSAFAATATARKRATVTEKLFPLLILIVLMIFH